MSSLALEEELINTLMTMGFTERQCRAAVRSLEGKIPPDALVRCIEHIETNRAEGPSEDNVNRLCAMGFSRYVSLMWFGVDL